MTNDLLIRSAADVAATATSRREALRTAGRVGVGAALSMLPFTAQAREVQAAKFGASSSAPQAHDVLNYALTLEYLEYFFYKRAVDEADIPQASRALFVTIRDHELAHVNLLRTTIMGLTNPPGDPDVYEQDDFSYDVPGLGNPFGAGNYQLFLTLAQGFEDTGVRAYKGQATALKGTPYLQTALQIHSVEGRHAAAVRRERGIQGWIPLNQPDAQNTPIAAVYGPGQDATMFPSEANTTQGGVNVTTLGNYSAEDVSEAFDEPLGMPTVLAIAGPFITGQPT